MNITCLYLLFWNGQSLDANLVKTIVNYCNTQAGVFGSVTCEQRLKTLCLQTLAESYQQIKSPAVTRSTDPDFIES